MILQSWVTRILSSKVARAEQAGQAAIERYRQQQELAWSRTWFVVEITVTIHEEAAVWNIWDAEPYFPEQVEGVMVPYGHGACRTAEEASERAIASVERWNKDNPDKHVHIRRVLIAKYGEG